MLRFLPRGHAKKYMILARIPEAQFTLGREVLEPVHFQPQSSLSMEILLYPESSMKFCSTPRAIGILAENNESIELADSGENGLEE
jgi:hypothetical protein